MTLSDKGTALSMVPMSLSILPYYAPSRWRSDPIDLMVQHLDHQQPLTDPHDQNMNTIARSVVTQHTFEISNGHLRLRRFHLPHFACPWNGTRGQEAGTPVLEH